MATVGRHRIAPVHGAEASSPTSSADDLRSTLRQEISAAAARIADFFVDWDADGSGTIDCVEFRDALRAFGLNYPDDAVDSVFRDFDDDASGTITRVELERQMRKYAGIQVEQQYKLRRYVAQKRGSALSVHAKVDRSSGVPISVQLRTMLSQNLVRVIDLFRDWDEDANGLIDRSEFQRGMVALGVEASAEEAGRLFDEFDKDGGGTIEYAELNSLLRRRVESPPKPIRPHAVRRPPDVPVHLREGRMKETFAAMMALDEAGALPKDASEQLRRTAYHRAPPARARFSAPRSGVPPAAGVKVRLSGPPVKARLDELKQMWLQPRHGARHAWVSTQQMWRDGNQPRNLLPPRLASQMAPHRLAPRHHEVSSRTLARMRAVQVVDGDAPLVLHDSTDDDTGIGLSSSIHVTTKFLGTVSYTS